MTTTPRRIARAHPLRARRRGDYADPALGRASGARCPARHLHQPAHLDRWLAAGRDARVATVPAPARLPRWAAILIIYLVLVGLLIGVAILVIPPLVDQARELWAALPSLLHKGHAVAAPTRVDQPRADRAGRQCSKHRSAGPMQSAPLVNAVWGLVGGIFGVVTILILTFYLLVDFDKIVRFFIRLFPRAGRARVRDATHRVTTKVSAWLGGQLLLAMIIGSGAALGLWLDGAVRTSTCWHCWRHSVR